VISLGSPVGFLTVLGIVARNGIMPADRQAQKGADAAPGAEAAPQTP
jgi:multidrug efflux pump subunit AcrB